MTAEELVVLRQQRVKDAQDEVARLEAELEEARSYLRSSETALHHAMIAEGTA